MSEPGEPRDLGVLVVDDDFRVAKVHAAFVDRTPGFVTVGTAHTGTDALALVRTLRPDIVLLDVHLPDLSGLQVLDRLRSEGRGEGRVTAVVMVTAERGAEAVRAALHGGAMQYLVKPFDSADLAERLGRVAQTLEVLRAPADPEGGTGSDISQAAIDRAFGGSGARPTSASTARLPKGLSPESAALVLQVLREQGEVSAAEAGELAGLSRVSARRYLEHFVTAGRARVRLQYGSAGRPERRYRLV